MSRADDLERALRCLLDEIDNLGDVEFSKDLPLHEAEACWDYALSQAHRALRPQPMSDLSRTLNDQAVAADNAYAEGV